MVVVTLIDWLLVLFGQRAQRATTFCVEYDAHAPLAAQVSSISAAAMACRSRLGQAYPRPRHVFKQPVILAWKSLR